MSDEVEDVVEMSLNHWQWDCDVDEKRRGYALELASIDWGLSKKDAILAAQMIVEFLETGKVPTDHVEARKTIKAVS